MKRRILFTVWLLVLLFHTACVKQDYFGRSNLKQVLYFHIPHQIGKTRIEQDSLKIYVTMPFNTNLGALTPDSILVSTFAGIEPDVGEPQNFSGPVSYKVTAEDHSSVVYTVFVK